MKLDFFLCSLGESHKFYAASAALTLASNLLYCKLRQIVKWEQKIKQMFIYLLYIYIIFDLILYNLICCIFVMNGL
jgi:hypothetical protein